MKLIPLRTTRKPQGRSKERSNHFSERRKRLLHLLLRDLIPTILILLFVGWLSLQAAALITKVKPENHLQPQNTSRP